MVAEAVIDLPDRVQRRRPIQPGTRLWDEMGLVTSLFSIGSSGLLQAMHHAIATTVSNESVIRSDMVGRGRRSTASVMTWVYGGQEALAEGDRLREMHKTIKTTDEYGVTHHALASPSWAWVALSAPIAAMTWHKYFGRRPLTEEEEEEHYQEWVQLMRNLRVAEKEIPPTYAAYLDMVDDVIDNTLVAHPFAYEYLKMARHPLMPEHYPSALRPLWHLATFAPGALMHFVTIGTTPAKARRKLGLKWTAADELALRGLGRAVAYTLPLLPERIRYLPIPHQARKAHREQVKLQRMLDQRPM